MGSYMRSDTDACQPCGRGTYSYAGSWFPQQLVNLQRNGGSYVYEYVGQFTDGFPAYCSPQGCIWWWVFVWIFEDDCVFPVVEKAGFFAGVLA